MNAASACFNWFVEEINKRNAKEKDEYLTAAEALKAWYQEETGQTDEFVNGPSPGAGKGHSDSRSGGRRASAVRSTPAGPWAQTPTAAGRDGKGNNRPRPTGHHRADMRRRPRTSRDSGRAHARFRRCRPEPLKAMATTPITLQRLSTPGPCLWRTPVCAAQRQKG